MGCRIQLHSSRDDSGWSLSECQPDIVLRCDAGGTCTLREGNNILRQWAQPLMSLDWMQRCSFAEIGAAPNARWVGFLSYDIGRWFEALPSRAADDLDSPLFAFALCFPCHPERTREGSGFHVRSQILREYAQDDTLANALRSTFSREGYLAAVQRSIDYIAAGDVFQINLSQRFATPLRVAPAQILSRLIDIAPSGYGGLLEFDDLSLICNSPELFLHVTPDRRVVTRPIKGTRPRQPNMDIELEHSIKDQAELNMIVDLERNDLGRVCEIGSVKVTEPRVIETHPTVFHGAATIEGKLRPDVSLVDLLRATFPGGSVTGAPKIRAMEIIEELEPVRRGPYCGAIGYVAASGEIMFNIAIRTMIAKDGLVHIPVGGGIVADSDPAAEYEETLVKARAMFAALGISSQETSVLG